MPDLTNWLLVFLRVSAMFSVFPVFSARNFPVQLRLALGALLAVIIAPALPATALESRDIWGVVGCMATEIGVGLLFGFAGGMVFYALDMAGGIIATETGLSMPASVNPFSDAQSNAPSLIIYYLAAMLWLSLDMHHWMIAAIQRSYAYMPVGGFHVSSALATDLLNRTGQTFFIALQLSAPVMAVSFIISLVFSVLGRAVPQMNVFAESFTVRILVGLTVFGLTMQLMSQHIANYLRRLPEDMLRVAQLLGAG